LLGEIKVGFSWNLLGEIKVDFSWNVITEELLTRYKELLGKKWLYSFDLSTIFIGASPATHLAIIDLWN